LDRFIRNRTFNRTIKVDLMACHAFTFFDLIARNAQLFAGRTAWQDVEDDRSLTFDGLHRQVVRLAAGLQRQGVTRGDRIGVLGKNSLEYFLVYGAAAALGAVVLPVNWRLSPEEVRFNLADGAPEILLVDEEYQDLIAGVLSGLPSVRLTCNLRADRGRFTPLESLSSGSQAFSPADLSSDDGLVIIHTAAVAGRPRGALLSHGNLLCASLHFQCCFALGPGEAHLNLLPLFHVAGLFMAVQGFHAGALNLNFSRYDANQALEQIARHRACVMFTFSPILSSLLEAAEGRAGALAPLRAVMGLESAETIERYQAMSGGTFYSMYGQTETSCLASMGAYRDRPGAAGRPIPLGLLALLDEEDRPVPRGEAGEIALRGPMVFRGYWNLPEETARTFRGGWHHTGDLGRLDDDGYLWYAGRKADKELIKPGGENVYPAEVEAALLKHPALEAAVVFGVPDPKWKEGIKAVCQLRPGQRLDAQELIAFVGRQIASYKKPQYVEFVSELPRLPGGAPDRARIKALHGGA
jgi:long-chain acyl-CoA synthetase